MVLNTNITAQWATIFAFGVTGVGLAFNAGTYTGNVDNKIIQFEEKLKTSTSSINARFDEVGAIDENSINRNIVKNNLAVSRLEREFSNLKKTVGNLKSVETRFDLVTEQVRALETRASNSRQSEFSNDELAKINSRVDKLENTLKLLAAAPPSSSGKIEIQSDYTSQFETKSVQYFDISNLGCFRKTRIVECSILVKNIGSGNHDLRINGTNGGGSSRGFGSDGLPILVTNVRYGNQNSRRYLNIDFPPEIPSKFTVEFREVPENSKGFLGLEIHTGRGNVAFQNVAIQ